MYSHHHIWNGNKQFWIIAMECPSVTKWISHTWAAAIRRNQLHDSSIHYMHAETYPEPLLCNQITWMLFKESSLETPTTTIRIWLSSWITLIWLHRHVNTFAMHRSDWVYWILQKWINLIDRFCVNLKDNNNNKNRATSSMCMNDIDWLTIIK